MVLSGEMTARIRQVLEKHPEGISITDLVKSVDINRNTAGRYLENLLLSGQVEMRRFGMAKMYTLAKRLPVSSVLSLSSELVMQLDSGQRVFYANDPLLTFLGASAKDLFGKNIEFTPFSIVFEDVFTELLDRLNEGLKGEEWRGELPHPVHGRFFFCRITPTVSNEGKKGVSVLLEDISDRKRDEERIRQSEERLRSIFKASPVGIGVVTNRILLEVNDRFCQMTGYSPAELVGKSTQMLYPSTEAFDYAGAEYTRQIRQNGAGSIEIQWIKKDGTVIDVLLNTTPLDPADISGGITFTALDITERKQAEQALRESESKLQLALSGSEMGMWEIDIPSLKGSIDGRAAAILGMKKSDIGTYRADWDALSHPDDVPLIHQRLINHTEGRAVIFESEHRMRHTSGRWIWVLGRGKITRSLPDGSCIRISGTMQDITARKQAEQALRESEDRYRKLVEISPDAVILHQDGKIIYVNPAAVRVLGARYCGEIIGRSVLEFIHPGYTDIVRHNIEKDLAGERTPAIELQMLRTDGTPIMVEGRGVSTSIGGSPAVLVAINDITERYQAGLALKESEERLRQITETLTSVFYVHDRSSNKFIYVSPAYEKIWKRTCQSLYDDPYTFLEAVHPDDLPRLQESIRQELEDGNYVDTEYRIIRTDGSVCWIHSHNYPVTDTDGKVYRVAGIAEDITSQRNTEGALRESEDRYRTLAEASRDLIFLIGRDDGVEYVNSYAAAIVGLPADKIIGKNRSSLFSGEPGERQAQGLRRVFETGKAGHTEGEMEIFGILHWFDHYLMPITNAQGVVTSVLGVSRDITDRKLADEQLLQREQQYRFISDNSLDIINRQTPDCIWTYVSPSITPLLGYSEEEVLGKSSLAMVHPDDLDLIQRNITVIVQNGLSHFASTFRFRHKDGRYLWFESTTKVIRDEKTGQVLEFLSMSRDITARKSDE